jgi:uncharacterized protein YutE (UPF0331/DUF86 family)
MTPEQLQARLALLRSNLATLDRVPQSSFAEFDRDFRNLPTALHLLQVTIQTLIDVGAYACAQRGLGAPDSSQAILPKLEEAGLMPAGTAQRFSAMFAFRNRIVHLYERIDAHRVYEILTTERADIEDLLAKLLQVLKPPTG